MQTRKYPRTLQEAFGPYCSPYISEPKETGYPTWWWYSMAVIAVLTMVLVVMFK